MDNKSEDMNVKGIEEQIDEETLDILAQALGGESNVNQAFEFAYQPMEFDDELMNEISNSNTYNKGVSVGAELAGMYITMINFGMDLKTCSDLIVNHQTLQHNLELQKIVNSGSVEVAKQNAITVDESKL